MFYILCCILVLAFVLSVLSGRVSVNWTDVYLLAAHFFHGQPLSEDLLQKGLVFLWIRLPRCIMALLVGAGLAVSGAVYQAYNQYRLLASIKSLCRSKKFCVVASMHDPNLASLFADDVIMLKNGRILFSGPKETVMTPANISALYDIDTRSIRIKKQMHLFLPGYVLDQPQ